MGWPLSFALIAIIPGLIAFTYNETKADWSFSFLASMMQHTHLVDNAQRGIAPIPNETREKMLSFKELKTQVVNGVLFRPEKIMGSGRR